MFTVRRGKSIENGSFEGVWDRGRHCDFLKMNITIMPYNFCLNLFFTAVNRGCTTTSNCLLRELNKCSNPEEKSCYICCGKEKCNSGTAIVSSVAVCVASLLGFLVMVLQIKAQAVAVSIINKDLLSSCGCRVNGVSFWRRFSDVFKIKFILRSCVKNMLVLNHCASLFCSERLKFTFI